MPRDRPSFAFLNAGHFLDHFFMLIFATVAALRLAGEWGMSYAALIPYATPGFVAFGIGALPAGWLADKWSREGMMVIFFGNPGVASAALLTGCFIDSAGWRNAFVLPGAVAIAIGAAYAGFVWSGGRPGRRGRTRGPRTLHRDAGRLRLRLHGAAGRLPET